MTLPILYNKVTKPVIGPKKPNKNKGQPNKDTAHGMFKIKEIFKYRTNVYYGLTSDETISAYFDLAMPRVLALSRYEKESKWNELKRISKWLKRSQDAAIIFTPMPSGSLLEHPKGAAPLPGSTSLKRKLTRSVNVYFRCVKLVDAGPFLKKNGQIMDGIDQTNENTQDIAKKEEEERAEEVKVIEEVNISETNTQSTPQLNNLKAKSI